MTAPAPWRFDVPEVPAHVTAFQDGEERVWVRRAPGSDLWSRWIDGRYPHTVRIGIVFQLGRMPLVECEDPRSTP